MRLRDKRIGIALVLWAFAACSEDAAPDTESEESPSTADEDEPSDEEPSDEADAGPSPTRDAGRRDASAPTTDAGDDAEPGELMPDGGRRRRDGGTRADASAPATDAAAPSPSSDAAVPAGDHCAPTASWSPAWAAFEEEVLRLTNEARAAGHNCDSEGNFGKTTPLTMNANLRCAARLYSKNMADNNFFSHDGKDGSTVTTRIRAAGYTARGTWGENIAMGQSTAAQVVNGWLESDGHCRNIMDPRFKEIGIGYFPKPNGNRTTPYWTQNFGG